jgi:hypothetical protein
MPEMREWRQQTKGGREMRPQLLVKAAIVACLVGAVIVLTGSAGFAQQGGPPPGKGGGGGHTEPGTNQLSYPAINIGSVGLGTIPAVPLDAAEPGGLGSTYSYGCDMLQLIGTTTYPNYSCIDALGNYLNAAACALQPGCGGKTPNRIYWQKTPNFWKAEETTFTPGVSAQYVDWGDNLESRSWTTTSTIRVETTPFKDHSTDPLALGDTTAKKGYQMWHVSGQGPDEQWGVRAEFVGDVDPSPPTGVYSYTHPYSIIKTANAMLNFHKLSGPETCPAVYIDKYPVGLGSWTGSSWDNLGGCSVKTEAYTAELNVGGKYVYGYNWTIRRDTLPATCPWPATALAGWWRLTFYTPNGSVVFSPTDIFDPLTTLKPPPAPLALPEALVTSTGLVTLAEETSALYIPVVSTQYNVTYIDICIKSGGGK